MRIPPFAGRIGPTVAESTPWWPPRADAGPRRPNVLVVLFDDVGFADLGCDGSAIAAPTIDALAARGVRLTGLHTTAMCSTTRAALLTGCNRHRVGMGCLANFDSGDPGYRGKIAPEAATLPEMLRPHGDVNYMVGKWHVTPLNETGPTGPFDGWPLGRGDDRFYGVMDAETDQYAPELVRDNTPIATPVQVPAWRRATLLIDGQSAGSARHAHGFNSLISWSGLDIGLDRGSPVSHDAAPFAFTGRLRRVTVMLDDQDGPDGEAVGQAELARQ